MCGSGALQECRERSSPIYQVPQIPVTAQVTRKMVTFVYSLALAQQAQASMLVLVTTK